MPHAETARLRAHFSRHNRRVILLAGVTALLAAAAWGLLGVAAYGGTLVLVTIQHPFDARMPAWFFPVFAVMMFGLCFLAWMIRRLQPDERARDDRSLAEILLDLVLLLPRVTLSVPGTLSAFVSLKQDELRLALALLQRIDREGSLPLHAVPIEIPDEAARETILLALQITEVVVLRKKEGEPALVLRDDAARALCQPLVRIRAR